ncbi:MAG: class I SAM-dependent methyltransferase [Steroidobacteraceae bacterium]
MTDEIDGIAQRYERRKAYAGGRYVRLNWDVLALSQERQRAMVSLLTRQGIRDLAGIEILEVGCGTGANLVELMFLGAQPERLAGNELLPDRIEIARRRLPESVRLFPGNAAALEIEPGTYDIVYQSVVFSSVLDDDLQRTLADAMWRWVKPGGGILWYDFIYDNPSNPDVRGVPLRRVRQLFPAGRIQWKRVTLAPPLARRVVRVHPSLYALCNAVPLLRTHILCFIEKT